MTLHILRHGETEYNRLGMVQGSGVDSVLNNTGHKQSSHFFEFYRKVPFELVVTSALQRTHQTVAPFIRQGLPWVKMADINEISWGEHEGQPSTPERMEIYRQVVDAWKSGNLDAGLPGGETARQLNDRLLRFLEWLESRTERHILICTHGRTLRCMVALMKGLHPDSMEGVRHANTGCYIIHRREGRYVFERENCVRHLPG